MKPITLWSHHSGPNPWKVAMVMEELEIPYETKFILFEDVKKEPFLSLNPNGRVPVIEDPNTGITLWESGAIVEYLIETYDKDNKLTYAESPNKHLLKQWLHFQVSGQGPYYGQAVHFSVYAPEKIPYGVNRYKNEIKRVTSVLEKALEGRDWLVGDKYTYADLSFLPWQSLTGFLFPEGDLHAEYPRVKAWLERMQARPAVKKVQEEWRIKREEGAGKP